MKLNMSLLIALSSLLLMSNAIADCSKHKKSCIGAGCEISNVKYEQCIASKDNKKNTASASGKRIIVTGSSISRWSSSEFKGVYFDFNYQYEMQYWTLLGEPVVTCSVIWTPKNKESYTFQENGKVLDINVPASELSSPPKVTDIELLIPIHHTLHNFTNTNYVKCDGGALGTAGKKNFTTPESPAWNKILARNIMTITSENFINLNYSFIPSTEAKTLTSQILKKSKGIITDNGAVILSAKFNTSAYDEWLRKKNKKETKSAELEKEEDDFWSGKSSNSSDEEINDNSSTNDNDFWAGGTEEPSKDSFSDDNEWLKKGESSDKSEDFWGGGSEYTREKLLHEMKIYSPKDNITTNNKVQWISGKVPKGKNADKARFYIEVNGRPQSFEVDGQGQFRSAAVIESGINTVSLVGELAENRVKIARTINYTGKISRLRATLVWENQGDIDLHLSGPNGIHISYQNKSFNRGENEINLDVDNTSGYGPENISVVNGIEGDYRISVVNYGNINKANVTVHLFLNGRHHKTINHTFNGEREWLVDTVKMGN
ncbi:hypothetical protein NBRC116592_03920 [Colwellia sp. KU-HH00111]|uniref:hypothetical protein n=1 Tax=Colwellia sp. KU-HH00111 TaxID=3127652 RepID=UPI003105A24E